MAIFLQNDPNFAHYGWVLCKFCTYDGCFFAICCRGRSCHGPDIHSKFPGEYPPPRAACLYCKPHIPKLLRVLQECNTPTSTLNLHYVPISPQDAKSSHKKGGFEWPILAAAIASAIVFFVIGVLVSVCIRGRNGKSTKVNILFIHQHITLQLFY